MKPIFITGIGTGVGKTLVSAIVTEALCAHYWKPVQAGFADGTDAAEVTSMLSNPVSRIFPECYRFSLPASPHIAARAEKTRITKQTILEAFDMLPKDNPFLVVEGAGGLWVPLSEDYFVADLIRDLQAKVLVVSRNYLGSINHSLLTAKALQQMEADVAGWIFNDQYLQYEDEIAAWTGFRRIASIPFAANRNKTFVAAEAQRILPALQSVL